MCAEGMVCGRGWVRSVLQIKSFLLVYGAVKTTINDQGWCGYIGKDHLGVNFCVGLCAEGMGCGRRWVRWVLRGALTASGHPGVP